MLPLNIEVAGARPVPSVCRFLHPRTLGDMIGPCPSWCSGHDFCDGKTVHRHVIVDDDHRGVEGRAAGFEPKLQASIWLADTDDRLEHLDAAELRRWQPRSRQPPSSSIATGRWHKATG